MFSLSPSKLSLFGRAHFDINPEHSFLNGGVQFDMTDLPKEVSISIASRVHACIGYDPARGWVLINGGPVSKDRRGRTKDKRVIGKHKWRGQVFYWARAVSKPILNGTEIASDANLIDGDVIAFVQTQDYEVRASLQLDTAGGERVIEHPTFDGTEEEQTVTSRTPISHIPQGAKLEAKKPDDISLISWPFAKKARRITDVVEDAAHAKESYDSVFWLLVKYLGLVTLSALVVIGLTWLVDYLDIVDVVKTLIP